MRTGKSAVPASCISIVLSCAGAFGAGLAAQRPAGAPTLPGNVVDVAAMEYAFRAPDTIHAGLTTFRLRQEGRVVDGEGLTPAGRAALAMHEGDATAGFHMLWVVRLDSSRTVADFFASARADSALSHARLLGGPGFAFPPGSTNATMMLEPGRHVLVCFVGAAREDRRRYHLLKGMFRELTVVPATGRPIPLPSADVVITLEPGGKVAFSAPIARAGIWRIEVRNRATRWSEFRIARLLPGHTVAEARAWRRADGLPPVAEPWAGLAAVPLGGSVFTTVDLSAGTYLANGESFSVGD